MTPRILFATLLMGGLAVSAALAAPDFQLRVPLGGIKPAEDFKPDDFTFPARTGQAGGQVITSDSVTVSGYNQPITVSVGGDGSPEINVNGAGRSPTCRPTASPLRSG